MRRRSSPACSAIGYRTRNRALLRPLWRGRLARWPNVRFPIPIAAFRPQGRFSQLSATSGLYVERQKPSRRVQQAGRLAP
jgi:hypothetical protein